MSRLKMVLSLDINFQPAPHPVLDQSCPHPFPTFRNHRLVSSINLILIPIQPSGNLIFSVLWEMEGLWKWFNWFRKSWCPLVVLFLLSYCFGTHTQLPVTIFRHQIWEWILYFLLIVENLLLLSHLRPHQVYSNQEHLLFVYNILRFKSIFLSFVV